MSTSGILYLDFDGPLHPVDVRVDAAGEPYVPHGTAVLFENAPLLEQLLEPYPSLRIVLSTSWVRTLGHDEAARRLSPGLAARVIGSTYVPGAGSWGESRERPRGLEVMADVRRRGLASFDWLAVDDAPEGWPDYALDNLVLVSDPLLGIRHEPTRAELVDKLRRFE